MRVILAQRHRKTEARKRDSLLADGQQTAYLATLGHLFPDAVEPAKDYLASLNDGGDGQPHRFVATHQREGRIESFHHFLGALFYPLILHAERFGFDPGSVLHVQDCGSMNRHLEALSEHIGVTLRLFPPEMSSSLFAAKSDKVLRLPPFDASNSSDKWLHDHEIETIRSFGLIWAPSDNAPDLPVLLISRGESDPHFGTQRFRNLYPNLMALNQTGSSRRHIPNEDEVIEAISHETVPYVVKLEAVEFTEQIKLFRRARIVIGQHGAGLNGLMWCKAGTNVLEILPHGMLGEPDTYFRSMARRLELRHTYMIQNGAHEPVDASAIGRYVARSIAGPKEVRLFGSS